MKKVFQYVVVAFVAATLITACGNKALKQTSLIPKDATAVFVLDQNAMTEKLKKGNFSMDSIVAKLMTSIDSIKGKKFEKDFKNSGIDLNEKLVMFITQNGNTKNNQAMSINLIAVIKDAKMFEAFLKSQEEFKTNEIVKGKLSAGQGFLITV